MKGDDQMTLSIHLDIEQNYMCLHSVWHSAGQIVGKRDSYRWVITITTMFS